MADWTLFLYLFGITIATVVGLLLTWWSYEYEQQSVERGDDVE